MFVVTSNAAAQSEMKARPTAIMAQIDDARILGTLGAGDIDQIETCKLAVTNATTSDIRDYAKMMVKGHQLSFKDNSELAKRFRLSRTLPQDSTMARAHKQEMTQLNLLTGAAFDRAFLEAMVADHAAQIADLKGVLLPGARRKEIKAFIRKQAPVLAAHQFAGQTLLDKLK